MVLDIIYGILDQYRIFLLDLGIYGLFFNIGVIVLGLFLIFYGVRIRGRCYDGYVYIIIGLLLASLGVSIYLPALSFSSYSAIQSNDSTTNGVAGFEIITILPLLIYKKLKRDE